MRVCVLCAAVQRGDRPMWSGEAAKLSGGIVRIHECEHMLHDWIGLKCPCGCDLETSGLGNPTHRRSGSPSLH